MTNSPSTAYLSDRYNIEIGFAQWMIFGVPLSAVLLVMCWFILTKVCYQVNEGGQVDTTSMFKAKLK